MKKQTYIDAQLYVDGCSFLSELYSIVRNMRVDDKHSLGYDAIKTGRDAVLNFSLSYNKTEITAKLSLALESSLLFENLDIQLNMMHALNVLTEKQFNKLYCHLGLLQTQISGWVLSLENKNK